MAKKILIVDDEVLIRWFVEKTVANWGYQVDTAGSADEAIELLKTLSYDVLITDIVMPGITGVELIEKAQKISRNLGIIACSAFFTDEIIGDFEKNGVLVLRKPFGHEELRDYLEKAALTAV